MRNLTRNLIVSSFLTAIACFALGGVNSAQAAQSSSYRPNRASGSSASGEQRFRPDFVVGGNGLVLQMPVQLSAGGYIPRWRFALSYHRQIFRKHWASVQIAALVDRGNWERFGSKSCGLAPVAGTKVCEKGAVKGFEIALGYEYRFFLRDYPYLVPSVRAGVGFANWSYPHRNGSRMQARTSAWSLDARVGGGIRWFLTHQIGVGIDLNLKGGLVRHQDKPVLANALAGQVTHDNDGFFGFEILPLCGEFRF